MWVDIPRDMWSLGFLGSFEKNVGMNVNEFADEFSNFFNTGSPMIRHHLDFSLINHSPSWSILGTREKS